MTRKFLIALLFATSTAAVAQQATEGMTEEEAQVEAAATNATLAMKICLQNYRDPDGLLQAFQQAGFAYTPEDFGGGKILHLFTTPDEHVQTAVAVTDGSVECRIGTSLWGAEAMLPFAQNAFAALTQGVEAQPGSPEGRNILPGSAEAQSDACSGFHALLPQSMLWVQILRQGNDGTCISDGTSVMRMIF